MGSFKNLVSNKLRNVAMDALMDLIKDLKAAKAAGKTDTSSQRRRTFSARRSSIWISSRRKTPPAFTRRKRPRGFSVSRLISPGKVRLRCATAN